LGKVFPKAEDQVAPQGQAGAMAQPSQQGIAGLAQLLAEGNKLAEQLNNNLSAVLKVA
jgi:hypothetical protein